MLGWEGCICRTDDAGKRCLDGRVCRGPCLFETYELVEEGHDPICDDTGYCRARLATRRPVGQCAEFEFMYGCYSFIRDGEADKPPSTGPWRASRICVD